MDQTAQDVASKERRLLVEACQELRISIEKMAGELADNEIYQQGMQTAIKATRTKCVEKIVSALEDEAMGADATKEAINKEIGELEACVEVFVGCLRIRLDRCRRYGA